MAGNKTGAKRRKRDARAGKAEIRSAERRLAAALDEVEAAREKAARRERKLRGLLEKHGRLPVAVDNGRAEAEAVPPMDAATAVETNAETEAPRAQGAEQEAHVAPVATTGRDQDPE